jgi:hypothetical protein
MLLTIAGAVVLLSACARSNPSKQIEAVYDKQSGRLQVLKYDRDKNGTPETVSYMDGSRVLRIEIDENEDGTVDRWEYYDANQKLERVGLSKAGNGKEDRWEYLNPEGAITRVDIAGGGDGKVTRTEYYEKNTVVRAEEDSNADGTIDKWETYGDGGQLLSVAFDTRHRGTPDRRLIYSAGGDARLETIP